MIASVRLAAAVAVPLLAALLILLWGSKGRTPAREKITLAAAVVEVILTFSLAPSSLAGKYAFLCIVRWDRGLELALRADEAAVIFACIASGLWLVTSVYSLGYVRVHHEKNQTGYFAAFSFCMAAVAGVALAANLFTFFIFFEMLTVGAYPLVTHYRDEASRQAGRKYLGYTLVSGQLSFAGILYFYGKWGNCDFEAGGFVEPGSMGQGEMLLLFFLLLAAGLVKGGLIPFHGWLPSAMVAPTPVSALLHAVAVVKAGVFWVLRIVCYVFGPESAGWCGGVSVLAWAAVITMLLSSVLAIGQDQLKARLAFSTIGQLAYILLGIALLSPYSIAAALFHMAAHGFLKITLFFCSGVIFVTTGISQVSKMRALAGRMPFTCFCFCLASFGLAGLPLLAGFVSKLGLLEGAFLTGNPLFAFALAGSAMLAFGYLFPVIQIFLGIGGFKKLQAKERKPLFAEGPVLLLGPLALTAALSMILGWAADAGFPLCQLAGAAAEKITGMELGSDPSAWIGVNFFGDK